MIFWILLFAALATLAGVYAIEVLCAVLLLVVARRACVFALFDLLARAKNRLRAVFAG